MLSTLYQQRQTISSHNNRKNHITEENEKYSMTSYARDFSDRNSFERINLFRLNFTTSLYFIIVLNKRKETTKNSEKLFVGIIYKIIIMRKYHENECSLNTLHFYFCITPNGD